LFVLPPGASPPFPLAPSNDSLPQLDQDDKGAQDGVLPCNCVRITQPARSL